MQFPDFFAKVQRLRVRDPLADFLGAADDGVLEYGYEDAVKLAGHSCPTVGSAYVLTCHALAALYPGEVPERGGVRVEFRDGFADGVTGVVASVVTLLTGATQEGGFKGLAGRFVRRGLQRFGADVPLAMRFTRLDTGAAVDAEADSSHVPADPEMAPLMGMCLRGEASADERRRFGVLWQERVARIVVDHAQDTRVFRIVPVG
jgi:formylmethanofuran dehydrogenase subunit E